MLDITIIAIGSMKEQYFRGLVDMYAERLHPFAKMNIIELPYERFTDSTKKAAKKKEAEKIRKAIDKFKPANIVLLDENGTSFNSIDFANWINSVQGKIVFVLGGSLGFDDTLIDEIPVRLSLSDMTLPHEMARVVLTEQIYRAITILKSKSYHH